MEVTCHLDAAGETVADTAFLERAGRGGQVGTPIVIARRIRSALRARRILVLDGATAQVGIHGTLLRSSPLHRDLVGYWQAAT